MRILARELEISGSIDEVVVTVSPVEVNADLSRSNPLAQIPVLMLDDGTALYDSSVICDYLECLGKRGPLLPTSDPARWSGLRLQALCDGILHAAVLCRYEAAVRPSALRWDSWSTGQRRKIAAGLSELASRCDGWQDTFSLTQIGAVCVLGYLDFRFAEWAWRDEHPSLAIWFFQVSNRASVMDTVPTLTAQVRLGDMK